MTDIVGGSKMKCQEQKNSFVLGFSIKAFQGGGVYRRRETDTESWRFRCGRVRMSSLILMLLPSTVIIDFALPSLNYLKESISFYCTLAGCNGDAHNGLVNFTHTTKLLISNSCLTNLEKLKTHLWWCHCITPVLLRDKTLFLDLWNPECIKLAMNAILKCTRVNVVSWIIHESIYSACQDRNHLHFIRLTDGHCRFDSNMKQDLSLVISSLIFSDFDSKPYFSSYSLDGIPSNLCFVSAFVLLLAHYNEHFVVLLWSQNTNEQCDGNRRRMWINFPNTVYLYQQLKRD